MKSTTVRGSDEPDVEVARLEIDPADPGAGSPHADAGLVLDTLKELPADTFLELLPQIERFHPTEGSGTVFYKAQPTQGQRVVPDAIIRICLTAPDFSTLRDQEAAFAKEAEQIHKMLGSLPQGVLSNLADLLIAKLWPIRRAKLLARLLKGIPGKTLQILLLDILKEAGSPEDALSMLEAVKEKVNEAWSGEEWERE